MSLHFRIPSRLLKYSFFFFLFLLMPQTPLAVQSDIDSSRKELEEIRQRIGKTSRTLEEKKRAEKSVQEDLKKVERSLQRISARVAAISSELALLNSKISGTENAMGETGAQIEGLSGLVRQRIVALYKGGGDPLSRALIIPNSSTQYIIDDTYWQRIVQNDRDLLGGYKLRLDLQNRNLQQLSTLQQEQIRLKTEMERERREMAQLVKIKEDLLKSVRKDKTSLSRQLESLKGRAKRIDGLIRNLETTRNRTPATPGTSFSAQKGRLSWPVKGQIRIPFGNSRHPELGTPYQSHGIEIEVSGGLSVKSVWSGKVVFANVFKGYNNLLILDHGDGYYTLYAQTDQLNCKVGDQISRGQVVARTDGGGGRFYFEIRKGGTPLDPQSWLE